MRYFLDIAFKGTDYHGWQRQPNAITVQEVVEESIQVLLQKKVAVTGAGRTDTGVHAQQLTVHLDSIDGIEAKEFCYRINKILPSAIAVSNMRQVLPDAHARFDAITRQYKYYIHTKKDPFATDNSYYLLKKPEVQHMNTAAQALLNYTNFKCFSKTRTDVNTYHCTITEAFWEQRDHVLVFTITANRFLRNMVRAIVGTLLEIGFGKLSLTDIPVIIKSENRSDAGYSVPAHGLYLNKIVYPDRLFDL